MPMRELKKFYAMLTVIIITICIMVPGGLGANAIPTDVKDTEYEEAVTRLSDLGIVSGYSDGLFKPNDAITRAELTKIIITALGVDFNPGSTGAVAFKDVPDTHFAVGYIQAAYGMKIISGYEDGRFCPDDTVNYEQAVKMIVAALGYTPQAENKGGYPVGYLIVAAEKGITKNIDSKIGDQATRGVVAKLVYNSLEVDYMDVASYSSQENTKYIIRKGNNILSSRLNTVKKNGIVTGIDKTRLTGEGNLKEDEVEIDGIIYKIGNTNAKEYFGYQVEYYAKQEKSNDDPVLMSIQPQKDKNNVRQVNASDIDKEKTRVDELVYWPDRDGDKNEIKLEISRYVDVIYNGLPLMPFDESDLKPDAGIVKLIDNNGDNEYDVVIIDSFDNYVVDSVKQLYYRVVQKYGESDIELDPSASDYEVHFTKDGNSAKFEDIKPWDVLCIRESKNPTIKKQKYVQIVSTNITGKITEVDDDSVVIDGKSYDIAPSYLDAVNQNNPNAKKLAIDDQGNFYLDCEGKIAGFDREKAATDKKYAYLIEANTTGSGLSSAAEFKMFTTDNKLITVKSAESLKYNGITKNMKGERYTGKTVLDESAFVNNGKFNDQLIIYDLDQNGDLCEINTAVNGYDTDRFSLDWQSQTAIRINDAYVFAGRYPIDQNTTVFRIVTDDSGNLLEDYFKIWKYNDLKKNTDIYKPMIYDIDSTKIGKVLVLKLRRADFFAWSNVSYLMLVNKVSKVVNENGDIDYKLIGVYNGKNVEYVPKVEQVNELLEKIKSGDVLQVGLEDSKIIDIKRIFTTDPIERDPETGLPISSIDQVAMSAKEGFGEKAVDASNNPTPDLVTGRLTNATMYTMYGVIVSITGPIFEIKTDLDTVQTWTLSTATKYYFYDETKQENKRVSIITKDDILGSKLPALDGSKVFINMRYSSTRDVVIYKLKE